jgi:hypothetical protein
MNTIEKKSVNAGKCTTKQEVDNLITSYKKERWAANSDQLGKADSLSVWFSVEDVEAFLAKVKTNGGNGIRMHFGVYSAENAIEPEFEGRQTLVMIGNRSSDGSFASSKELYASNGGKPEIVALAGGLPCPPFCGGPTLGKATLITHPGKNWEVI